MKTINTTLWFIILICLALLVIASIFVWQNPYTTITFSICIILWTLATYER